MKRLRLRLRRRQRKRVKIPGNPNVTRTDLLGSIRDKIPVAYRWNSGKRYLGLYKCPRSLILHPQKPSAHNKKGGVRRYIKYISSQGTYRTLNINFLISLSPRERFVVVTTNMKVPLKNEGKEPIIVGCY